MQFVLDFLKEYYYLILLCLFVVILLLQLLILLIKKKDPSIISNISAILPSLVKDAEAAFGSGHGAEKLEYVFQMVRDYIANVYDRTDFSSYKSYVKARVEEILSTPQKKGE